MSFKVAPSLQVLEVYWSDLIHLHEGQLREQSERYRRLPHASVPVPTTATDVSMMMASAFVEANKEAARKKIILQPPAMRIFLDGIFQVLSAETQAGAARRAVLRFQEAPFRPHRLFRASRWSRHG